MIKQCYFETYIAFLNHFYLISFIKTNVLIVSPSAVADFQRTSHLQVSKLRIRNSAKVWLQLLKLVRKFTSKKREN